MRDLTITMLQMDLQWRHPIGNYNAAEQLIAEMDEPTDLIILPEMFNTGFTLDAADNAETMEGPTVEWLQKLADRQQTAVCGSLIVNDNGKYFNRMVWVLKDGAMGHYDKRHLFRMGGEDEGFSAGNERRVFTVGEWRIFPQICYDLRFPYLYRALAKAGAQMLTVPAAFTRPTGEAHWHLLLRARAVETGCFVFAPAQCGTHVDGRETYGHSLVVAPWGEVLEDGGEVPGVVLADIDFARVAKARSAIPSLTHDRDFSGPES